MVRVDTCLIPDLSRNAFSFSTLSVMLTAGLSYMAFVMLRYVPSMWSHRGNNKLVNITKKQQIHRYREQASSYSEQRNGAGAI